MMEPSKPGDQPAIKYESPYSMNPPPRYNSQSPQLKRRRSDSVDPGNEGDDKRQRISDIPPSEDLFDLEKIIAAATDHALNHVQGVQTTQPAYALSSAPTTAPFAGANTSQNSYEPQAVNSTSAVATSAEITGGLISDPHLYMRILSLPILESLSLQMLATLASSQAITVVTQPESEFGQAYTTLKSLFDQTKKIYSQQAQFLSADELNIRDAEHRATIRTTNLATFVSSVFGGQDVSFYELNDHFIEIFVPDGGELEKNPGMLYLNLKTQMFLSAMSQEEQEKPKDDILTELFPTSLEQALLARHPGRGLTASEQDFLNEAKARRDFLQNEAVDVNSIQELNERFAWEDFLRGLSTHLKESYEPLLDPYMRKHTLTAPIPSQTNGSNSLSQLEVGDMDDTIDRATREAERQVLQSIGYGGYNGIQHNPGLHQAVPHQGQVNGHNPMLPSGYSSEVPYHTQSAPTQVLYEQARQAAVAKTSTHARRPGLPSQRRPWTTEEENALMAGLDQVKGPHWSQILALYGPKGSVSEILKERNQVQLKDKARNLKLFFLKSNIEVPYYLQCVTGELKTRAPTQAARKEAEERARLASDDSQARFNAIMGLAGASQAQAQAQAQAQFQTVNGQPTSDGSPQPSPAGAHRRSNSQEELVVSEQPEKHADAAFEQDLSKILKESMEEHNNSTPTSVSS